MCMAIPSGKKIPTLKDKKPSQRLRAVIYRYWEQSRPGANEDEFEAFYEKHVDNIVEQYKSKLKPRV